MNIKYLLMLSIPLFGLYNSSVSMVSNSFTDAIKSGNYEKVKKAVDNGKNVNTLVEGIPGPVYALCMAWLGKAIDEYAPNLTEDEKKSYKKIGKFLIKRGASKPNIKQVKEYLGHFMDYINFASRGAFINYSDDKLKSGAEKIYKEYSKSTKESKGQSSRSKESKGESSKKSKKKKK